jgi:hypothetical protein
MNKMLFPSLNMKILQNRFYQKFIKYNDIYITII